MTRPAPVLLRRRYVSDYEAGPRPVPPAPAHLRVAGPALLPASALACVVTDDAVVALTYDDGPHPASTPGVLDALADAGAHATFFVLAERAERHSRLVERIVSEGHEVALHGWDHARLTTLDPRQAIRRTLDARRRLEDVAGVALRWFRPAYGAITLSGAAAVRAAGLDVVVWSAWAQDWLDDPACDVAARAAAAAHHGGILLMHDATAGGEGRPAPRFDRGEATRLMLRELTATGWATATVGDLLDHGPQGRVLWSETRRQGRARAVDLAGVPV